MKERPIIFSGPMVRALPEGRKTQTRRVVKQGIRPYSDDHFDGMAAAAEQACRIAIEQYEAYQRAI